MNVFVNPVQTLLETVNVPKYDNAGFDLLVFNRLTVLRYKVEFRNEIKNSEN